MKASERVCNQTDLGLNPDVQFTCYVNFSNSLKTLCTSVFSCLMDKIYLAGFFQGIYKLS